MSLNNTRTTSPVKPYDDSMSNHWIIYDNIPYQLDTDICDTNSIGLQSGNLVKFFRCKMNEQPFELNN